MFRLRLLFLLFVVGCVSMTNSASNNTCPIPNTGKTGNRDSVFVSFYYCYQATSSGKPACSPQPERQVTLKKGETVDLKYYANGYTVTAKFFGDEICVAYRRVSRRLLSSGYRNTDECDSQCFGEGEEELETYYTDLVCSSSCGGGYKRLKFVSTSGSQSRMAIPLSVVLITCVLIASGLVW